MGKAEYPAVGERVLVDIGPGWSEPATVTARDGHMATVQLDETIEVPGHLGGGWMLIVDREIETLERLT
jgi:hypothetical protein